MVDVIGELGKRAEELHAKIRLAKDNPCHKPHGPGGGQFCSRGGGKGKLTGSGLDSKVKELHSKSPWMGSRSTHSALKLQGHDVSEKDVRESLSRLGLKGKPGGLKGTPAV